MSWRCWRRRRPQLQTTWQQRVADVGCFVLVMYGVLVVVVDADGRSRDDGRVVVVDRVTRGCYVRLVVVLGNIYVTV